MSSLVASPHGYVRVLEVDPDLTQWLDEDDLEEACLRAVGTLEAVDPGPWQPHGPRGDKPRFGGLVLEGLIVRELALGSSVSAELLGAGDVLVPYAPDEVVPFVPSEMGWTVLEPTRIAWLDAEFAAAARRWPQLGAALLERTQRRADRLAVTLAITQITRVDDRVLALLWHLSERWGRMSPAGVVLPVRLTHKALARLVGAQRPTVTTAIAGLEKRGLVERRHDGAWVLGTPEQPARAGVPDDASPWHSPKSASLVAERPPPVPLDVRLAQLSETFARSGGRTHAAIHRAREVSGRSLELREQARAVRGAPKPALSG